MQIKIIIKYSTYDMANSYSHCVGETVAKYAFSDFAIQLVQPSVESSLTVSVI